VDLAAVADNFRILDSTVPHGDSILVVVKADAYGHGLLPVANAAVGAGATHFGVATLEEGATLRRAGIGAEVHVLTPLLPTEAVDCARLGLVPYISSTQFLDAFRSTRAPFPPACFVMVDTGMGREGLSLAEATALVASAPPGIRIAGVATHLASADEVPDLLTEAQETRFRQWLAESSRLPGDIWRSLANSPGMLRVGRPDHGPVLWRPGTSLYGITPYPGAPSPNSLRPVLAWKARITLVRDLPAGSTVGYGATATLSRNSRIATVAVGYADGLSRRLSNCGVVSVRGHRCPIVGRVSMDQCQIDVTDVPGIVLGDIAVLLGADGSDTLRAEDMAQKIGTTVHEPTTCLSARVPRLYNPAPDCPR